MQIKPLWDAVEECWTTLGFMKHHETDRIPSSNTYTLPVAPLFFCCFWVRACTRAPLSTPKQASCGAWRELRICKNIESIRWSYRQQLKRLESPQASYPPGRRVTSWRPRITSSTFGAPLTTTRWISPMRSGSEAFLTIRGCQAVSEQIAAQSPTSLKGKSAMIIWFWNHVKAHVLMSFYPWAHPSQSCTWQENGCGSS